MLQRFPPGGRTRETSLVRDSSRKTCRADLAPSDHGRHWTLPGATGCSPRGFAEIIGKDNVARVEFMKAIGLAKILSAPPLAPPFAVRQSSSQHLREAPPRRSPRYQMKGRQRGL